MKMKHLLDLEERVSAAVSNNPSTSSASRHDQEMGSNAMSTDEEMLFKSSKFHCLPRGIDLDPARMVIAEMMGSFILMFCISGIIASTQLMRGQVGLLEYASTAGLTVVVLVFSLGPISGAHVNPSVTIAFAIFGHFSWSKVPLYIMAQIVGSAMAAYVGKYVYGINPELMTTRPTQGFTSAFWVELITSFILMFLTASLMYHIPAIGHLTGFVIGIAIGLAVLITGPISGGSMNPARSLGPAIVSWNFKDIWIYLTAPVIGSIAGALMFHALRLQRRPCSSSSSSPGTNLLVHSIPFGGI